MKLRSCTMFAELLFTEPETVTELNVSRYQYVLTYANSFYQKKIVKGLQLRVYHQMRKVVPINSNHSIRLCAPSLFPNTSFVQNSFITCQTIHYDRHIKIQSLYIPVIPKSQWQGPRRVLFCGLTAVYCIQASVLLRVPHLKFPSLPISLPPMLLPFSSPSLRCSLIPPLASSLPSFLRSVHAYVPSSLVPILNLPSLPPLPLPPSLTSSLPHALPLLPPSPLFPCSLPPFYGKHSATL